MRVNLIGKKSLLW